MSNLYLVHSTKCPPGILGINDKVEITANFTTCEGGCLDTIINNKQMITDLIYSYFGVCQWTTKLLLVLWR